MKQLNKTQSVILLAGALLMVVGVVMYVFRVVSFAAWLFAAGTVAFAVMQLMQTYTGDNFTVRRLRRILDIGDILFILSGLLMLENSYHWLLPLFCSWWKDGYYHYLNYIHNNWVVLLLVAAMLELYCTHRIANEMGKEAKKR